MGSDSTSDGRIELDRARRFIAIVWFAGGGLCLALMILQSIIGRFEGVLAEMWAWFTPTIAPTVGLIIGVLASTALEDDTGRTVKKFFYDVSVGLSLVYLITLLVTMLLEPVAGEHNMAYFKVSNFWLSPLQGFVVAALGALFNSRKKTDA